MSIEVVIHFCRKCPLRNAKAKKITNAAPSDFCFTPSDQLIKCLKCHYSAVKDATEYEKRVNRLKNDKPDDK